MPTVKSRWKKPVYRQDGELSAHGKQIRANFEHRKDRYHIRRARDVENRVIVSRLVRLGANLKTIRQETGLSIKRIKRYREVSLNRLIKMTATRPTLPTVPRKVLSRTPLEEVLAKKAFELRKRAISYEDIATAIEQPEEKVRDWIREEIQRRDIEDLNETALHRRLELERIDAMMAAIMTPATGIDKHGRSVQVSVNAIDRMIRLMEARAKLLGLHAPQTVDINQRIELLAIQYEYDVDELKDIARDVLQRRHKKALPPGGMAV